MDEDEGTEDLINQLWKTGMAGKPGIKGDPRHVRMWVRDKFRCVYCGEDLLRDLVKITSAQLDHLLPKDKYPEYWDNEDNWVLACFCCNQLKRNFDLRDKLSEDRKSGLTPENLSAYRDELIEAGRAYLLPQLRIREEIRNRIIGVLAEHNIRPADG